MNTPENILPSAFTAAPIAPSQVLAILRAHRKWVVGLVFGFVVVGFAYSKLAPKVYVSTAQLLVDFDVNDPISNRDFPSQLASSYLSTQIDFVNSPKVLLPVVDTLGWISDAKLAKGFKQAPGGGGLREYLMEKVLAKNLSVRTIKDSRLIHISYEAETAAEAARVANTVASTYIEQNRQRFIAPLKERSAEYGQQLEELRQKVDQAQVKVTEFRNRTGLVELNSELDSEIYNLREMEQKFTDAQIAARQAAERRRVASRNQDSAGATDTEIEFLGNPYVQTLKGQLVAAEGRFAELAKTLGPRHPEYIAKQAELASLRERLARESGLFYGSVGNDAEKTGNAELGLKASIDAQRKRVLKIRSQQEEGASLVRDLDAAKKLYAQALEIYDRVLLPAQGGYSNVSLLSPALPPLKHSKPLARNNALLGLIAGGLLGGLLAFVLELRNRKVRCPADVATATGELPLLQL